MEIEGCKNGGTKAKIPAERIYGVKALELYRPAFDAALEILMSRTDMRISKAGLYKSPVGLA